MLKLLKLRKNHFKLFNILPRHKINFCTTIVTNDLKHYLKLLEDIPTLDSLLAKEETFLSTSIRKSNNPFDLIIYSKYIQSKGDYTNFLNWLNFNYTRGT